MTITLTHLAEAGPAAFNPDVQVAERRIVLDTRRPRTLCRCAAVVATALMRAGRTPDETRRAALVELEAGLERVRRSHPEAWRAARHVDTLGRLMAMDAVTRAATAEGQPQAKASGSAALRSAT